MSQPLVSILIPCYNAARYIGETLESVLAQTWHNIEIIIVDDGSTDGSAAVVGRYAQSRLSLFRQPNAGQTSALNACLAHVKGDFIQYLDADDLIAPDKIELQIRRLMAEPGCIASAEWGRFHERPGGARFEPEAVWRDLPPLDWLALSRAQGLGMMFPALWLIPRTIVDAIGPWREELTLNNDAEYFTRALLACKRVLFCPAARSYYRSGIAGSLSGQKTAAAWQSQIKVLELCEQHVRAREDSERMRRAFALSWQHIAHACYPYEQALAEKALERAAALHDVDIRPGGGTAFRLVSRLVGWRAARRLQVLSGRP